jgi:hypothetical protein
VSDRLLQPGHGERAGPGSWAAAACRGIDGRMQLVPVYAFATDAVGKRRIKGHERGGTKSRAA